MDVNWLLFMWYSSLLTSQHVTISSIIYLNWNAPSYTNDSLDRLHKQAIFLIILYLLRKLDETNYEANHNVLEQVRNLSDAVTKLSSEVSITKNKNVNTLLPSRLVTLAQQCSVNALYSRRECLEIVAIPCKLVGKYWRNMYWQNKLY